MPTYTYRCKSCSHEFEELQKVTEKRLITCPSCHQNTLVREIGGGAGLVFKGSGFYHTDYKKQGGTKADKDTSKKEEKPVAPKGETTKKQDSKT